MRIIPREWLEISHLYFFCRIVVHSLKTGTIVLLHFHCPARHARDRSSQAHQLPDMWVVDLMSRRIVAINPEAVLLNRLTSSLRYYRQTLYFREH